MRIAIISDLHADFYPDKRRAFVLDAIAETVAARSVEVLLIAGDLANRADKAEPYLRHFRGCAGQILVVPGNHDAWLTERQLARGLSSDYTIEVFARGCAAAGAHYLPGHPVIIGGWGFAGSIGWYDYSYAAPELGLSQPDYARLQLSPGDPYWQDLHYAYWRTRGDSGPRRATDPEFTERCLSELEADLRSLGLNEAGSGLPTIALTHHLPFASMVRYKGFAAYDYYSAFLGSSRFGELYRTLPAVRGAFAGHTHEAVDIVLLDGITCAVHPMGYYGSPEFPSDLNKQIGWFELGSDGSISRLTV